MKNNKLLLLFLLVLSCLFVFSACSDSVTDTNTNGEVGDSNNGNNTDDKNDNGDTTPHEHVEEIIPMVMPTCTQAGHTAGKKCSICGVVLEATEKINALGHTSVTIPKVEPTCTEQGSTQGLKCETCDKVLVAPTSIKELGHTEETLDAKAPTCTETGLTEGKKCSICDEVLISQEEVPACGHTEETIPAVPATCYVDGFTEGTRCSVCKEIIVAPTLVNAGHKYENSYSCSGCDLSLAEVSEGLAFELDAETDTYMVTGIGACTDKFVVIPYTYMDKPVTKIAANAFSSNNIIISIVIPESITSIDSSAFSSSTYQNVLEVYNLSDVAISSTAQEGTIVIGNAKAIHTSLEEPSVLENVNDYIFITLDEINYLVAYTGDETDIELPTSYNGKDYEIYQYAFYNNKNIVGVTISSGVTKIGLNAFCSSNVVTLNLNDVSTIEKNAFYNCYSLDSVTIGGETSIGESAFYYCKNLKNLTLENGVTNIGNAAFAYCMSLLRVVIPNSVEALEGNAFKDCTSLTSATIGDNVNIIKLATFNNCTSLAEISIGSKVERIESSAFENCTSLTSVVIPNSVTNIGLDAFRNCSSMTSLTIGEGVQTIREKAFYDCVSLTEVNFNAIAMEYYKLDGTGSYIFGNAGSENDGIELTIGEKVTKIPAYLFYAPDTNSSNPTFCNIKEVVFEGESACATIEMYAFCNCENLQKVIVPASVIKIDFAAFLCPIYYEGTSTPANWTSATENNVLYLYSKTTPETEGNYWHYVDGEVVVW